MAPVLFPAFLLAQGKLPGRVVCPLLAGPGFPCFGVGFPLGLEGALGFGAQGRRVQLFLDGPLEAFGVGPGTAVSAGRGGLKVRSLQWRWRKA